MPRPSAKQASPRTRSATDGRLPGQSVPYGSRKEPCPERQDHWRHGPPLGWPLIMSANRAIWQTHLPPAAQGRVFAVQGMLQQLSMPVGYLVAGPLADGIFEPAMQPGSTLSAILGGLVGTGPGAGMAVMFLGAGRLGAWMSVSGRRLRAVRC